MNQSSQPASNDRTIKEIREVVAGGGSSNMRIAGIQAPLVVESAHGCRLTDIEGRELIDLNMGYGPHIFGYSDRDVLADVADQLSTANMTGLPHRLDAKAGELIAEMVPSVQQVRFANSGTEACASAVRLARHVSGKNLVITFEGHYHGWSETLLRMPPSKGRLTTEAETPLGGAKGMIPESMAHTLQLPWNDFEAFDDALRRYGHDLAAVIAEPICANSGVVLPSDKFLEHLRQGAHRHGALLIFDEVITGFRVHAAGAQGLTGVTPDLTILSKVLGGGFPVAAFGGDLKVMEPLASSVAFHAGVYAGNHTAMRAITSMLTKLQSEPETYEVLEDLGAYVEERLRSISSAAGQPMRVARAGSVVSMALLREPVGAEEAFYHSVEKMDLEAHKQLQLECQAAGVYFHPNPFEPWFLSTAHTRADIDEALDVIDAAIDSVRAGQ